MAAAELFLAKPSDDLKIFNRGISGNRIVDLYSRIKSDIINLQPDFISILIGVNDTWHEKAHGNGVAVPKYERVYRELLGEVRSALPEVGFVLCEPFVLRCGVVTEEWIAEIDQRRSVVATLAQEFDALLIPFQSIFDDAVKLAPPPYWASDGVHPTAAGHLLMAKAWLEKTHFNA
jgi:lysophospholipase L1-like esterase